jgi:hypothetical protein
MANTIDITDAAVFIPELWSNEVLMCRERALVMAPLVSRYDNLVKEKGDTIHIPNVSELTANTKTANSEVTLNYPTETEDTITINTHKEVSFEIEDIVKAQSAFDLRGVYTKGAGYAIAKAIDADLLGLYSSLTSTDVGTYGVDVTDATIVAAIQTLDEADAPMEDRYFVIAPSQKAALMKLDKFVKADFLGQYDQPTVVRKGPNNRYLWGDVYGVPTYYTNQVPTTAGTPTQTHNLLFHKEAFALALQLGPRTQGNYIPKDLAWLVTVDAIWGKAVIRGDHGVEVRS